LSDGQNNVGDAVAEARQGSTRKVHVDVVPIAPPAGFQEILIDSLSAPEYVRSGQSFDVSAVVKSTSAGDATMRISMDGKVASQATVHLVPGANRFSASLQSTVKGCHTFDASISAKNDTYAVNNQAYAVE